MTFNINDKVKVRLTEHGHEILKQQYNTAVEQCPALKMFKFERYHSDADGWSEFTIWDLMKRFGASMGNGWEMPFDAVIRIEHSDVGCDDEEN